MNFTNEDEVVVGDTVVETPVEETAKVVETPAE